MITTHDLFAGAGGFVVANHWQRALPLGRRLPAYEDVLS